MTIDPVVHRRRWRTLGVLSLALLIIGLDNTVLNVALPSLQQEFDASGSTLQWIVDSYLLVFAGLLLTMGTLGDRFGRKLALQSGLAIFGVASLAVLVADTAEHLIVIRALMGVGGALIMPATLSIISNVFPREERAKAIGIWAGIAALGIGLGPLAGGLLLEWFDWTSVFLLNVPVVAVAFLLGMRLVPESRDPEPGAFDIVGAVLSIAALGVLVYGVVEAPVAGWTDPLTIGCFAVAAALVLAFIAWERHTPEPMLNLEFFRNPRFSVAALAVSLAFFSLFGSIFALTQFMQEGLGYTALEAGGAMAPLALGLMSGAVASTKLSERFGTTPIVAIGLMGLSVLLLTSLAWSPDMAYWPLGLWFFFTAMSIGFIMGPATEAVMGAVPEEKSGVASAMNDVTRQVAGALGTAIVGSLIASLYSRDMEGAVAGLPPDAASAAEDSIGRANAVAASLPADEGAALSDAAAGAFTDALAVGFTVAAAVAAVAALIVWRRLPSRHVEIDAPAVADPVPETVAV